jgi:hypothetical protein
VDTAGLILAVKYTDLGSQVVLLDGEGKVREAPGFSESNTERDAVWRPDGNRVYFVSDREKSVFQLYRWNPGSNRVEPRSIGTRSKSSPFFGPAGSPGANDTLLITAGGFVLELNPVNGHTRQILPPVPRDSPMTEEGGVGGQFEAAYKQLGSSFREARWTLSKRFVAAVMRREDGGEILIVQDLAGAIPPMPVAAGYRIDFDVSPTDDKVFFVVVDFIFPDPTAIPPEYIKDGKVIRPFKHMISLVDFTGDQPAMQPVVTSNDDAEAFSRIRISPDGSMIVTTLGSFGSQGDVEPKSLIVMPAAAQAAGSGARVLDGKVYEPSWHPDSNQLVFIRVGEDGRRSSVRSASSIATEAASAK